MPYICCIRLELWTAGIKYYGCHWGPPKTPFREDDSRHLPPNYYYPAEDYLIERVSSGAAWTW
jgi:hypothetical protein